MPRVSQAFILSAFVFLLAGSLLESFVDAPLWRPVIVHFYTLGWITQMIFGVALWMLPNQKFSFEGKKYYWGWVMFISLNFSLVFRAFVEPYPLHPLHSIGLKIASILSLFSFVLFLALMRGRILYKRGKSR